MTKQCFQNKAKHRGCFAFLVAVTALLLTNSAIANKQDFSVFDAHYLAKIKGFSVKARRTLSALEDGYFSLRFSASSWAARLEERSIFRFQTPLALAEAPKILPAYYHYYRNAIGKKRQHAQAFGEQYRHFHQSDTPLAVHTMEAEVLDRLNYQLQLQLDLIHGKSELNYIIADKGQQKHYHFSIVKDERLDTPVGQLDTVKVKMQREKGDKITYLWFAKDWHHLLVQLDQYEKGKPLLFIQITSATIDGQPLSR